MKDNPSDGAPSVTRRNALRVAGAAGLAGAAAVAGALPAQATTPDPLILEAANTAAKTTRLDITADPVGSVSNPGVEIRTTTARDTLRVHSEHGTAISATGNHTDTSRAAISAYGTYLGVYAQINGTNAPAVMGQGVGVGSRGVFGWGTGTNGIGVHGVATDGVGAVFEGSKANMSLRPMPGATHPAAGGTGDLYVDQTGRLWFCRAAGNPATWTQIA